MPGYDTNYSIIFSLRPPSRLRIRNHGTSIHHRTLMWSVNPVPWCVQDSFGL